MKISLICGGPSRERGISLNSARSVTDHLEDENIEINPFYFDFKKRPYKISKAQLYSNTPSDFDFKLKQTAKPLSRKEFLKALKQTDLVFPAVHGNFGEGGDLQKLLEQNNIPFIGSSSKACNIAFNKYRANEFIRSKGFFVYDSMLITRDDLSSVSLDQKVEDFFKACNTDKMIVKPANGGSSIGVDVASDPEQALEKAASVFSEEIDNEVVLEPFVKGKEFTCIVLENKKGEPVTLPPTEIETDYESLGIFDYRKKYLPTRQVIHHCPPRFSRNVIEKIREQAENLFSLFEMNDFARFDGWLDENGEIWFSDFNPISGMEQNSFLFQQASRVGLSHRDLLRYILKVASKRYKLSFPENSSFETTDKRKPVNVIFGGSTSERQVSLMSGTNAWLKLRRSHKYNPSPFVLDMEGCVWPLPYAFTLNHTVEEIIDNCRNFDEIENRLNSVKEDIGKKLELEQGEAGESFFKPEPMSLLDFVNRSDFVFIGLHGGLGEDGRLQDYLEKEGVKYNGSDSEVSSLCMDKWKTAEKIIELNREGIDTVPKKLVKTGTLKQSEEIKSFWQNVVSELKAGTVLVKPRSDGCSSGIVCLNSSDDFEKYLGFLGQNSCFIPAGSFSGQYDMVEMPLEPPEELILEKFIETDKAKVENNELKYENNDGWIEVTAGVLEQDGELKVFNPSLTLAKGKVLTVEEKFQGGTGINITPPPEKIVSRSALKRSKELLKTIAETLKIKGYARLDAFMNTDTGDIMLIEVNSLPALTPSTVLYQQALAEQKPIFPVSLLEKIIKNKKY